MTATEYEAAFTKTSIFDLLKILFELYTALKGQTLTACLCQFSLFYDGLRLVDISYQNIFYERLILGLPYQSDKVQILCTI